MLFPAVALRTSQPAATVSVFGFGVYGQAVASVLSMGGHRVSLIGTECRGPRACDVWTQGRAHYTTSVELHSAESDRQAIKSSDAIVMAVSGTEYGAAFEHIVPSLNSGQTVFIVGAAFGASFEVGAAIYRRRRDLALNIVETSQPFTAANAGAEGLKIHGLRERLVIAGRTLNETRAGLQVGNSLFSGLVPASNVLERGFCNMEKWLETASCLFAVFGPDGYNTAGPSSAKSAVVVALRAEIESLGRAYGVTRIVEQQATNHASGLSSEALKEFIELSVIEDFVMLSSLARLMYLQVPLIDSIIELASIVTGSDLRKEGRQLDDLGLIGMDATEIVELVSA